MHSKEITENLQTGSCDHSLHIMSFFICYYTSKQKTKMRSHQNGNKDLHNKNIELQQFFFKTNVLLSSSSFIFHRPSKKKKTNN